MIPTDLNRNLGFLLGLWLLFKEWVAVTARRTFVQLWVVSQLHAPFSGSWASVLNPTCLGHLPFGLLWCFLHGIALEDYSELVQNAAAQFCRPFVTHIIALLCKLHWLPVSFQVWYGKTILYVLNNIYFGPEFKTQGKQRDWPIWDLAAETN